MNFRHLGDALDHWKGNMFRWLKPALRELHVVPMFTDADPAAVWRGSGISCFSNLLGVPSSQILHVERRFRHRDRVGYFADLQGIAHDRDIFFDPDNGIASNGRAGERHVTTAELASFMPAGSDRLILVYQHASRVKDYVRVKLESVGAAPEFDGVGCLGYWAGNAAMIVASRDESRLRGVQQILAGIPTETGRVIIHAGPPSGP